MRKTKFPGKLIGLIILIVLAGFLFKFITPSYVGMPTAHDPDPLKAIDRILDKMDLGSVVFNAPKTMNIFDTKLIHVVLGAGKSIEELKPLIESEGIKIGAQIRMSERMEARLTGHNFTITAVTPEIQAISAAEVTEWKWEVSPKETGRQYLHLTLSALIDVEGESTPRAIRSFSRIIEIDVTWRQKIAAFVKNNWQWLWTVILIPLAGWLWKKRIGKV